MVAFRTADGLAARTAMRAVRAGTGSASGNGSAASSRDRSRGSGTLASSEAPGGTTGNDSQSFSGQRITIAAKVDRAMDTGNTSGGNGGQVTGNGLAIQGHNGSNGARAGSGGDGSFGGARTGGGESRITGVPGGSNRADGNGMGVAVAEAVVGQGTEACRATAPGRQLTAMRGCMA